MLKSRKTQQKGQGQQSRQKQLPWPAQHRPSPSRRRGDSPSGNSCGEARLLAGAARTGARAGGSLSLPSSEPAHSSHSFTRAFSASADRLLPPWLWGPAELVFFSALPGKDTRICSSRGPCGFRSDFAEPVRPGPRPQPSPRWLLKP